jgi:hypothetical protein
MPGTDSQDYLIGTVGTFILNYRNGLFVSKLRDGVSFALGLKHCRVTFPTTPASFLSVLQELRLCVSSYFANYLCEICGFRLTNTVSDMFRGRTDRDYQDS